MALVTTAPVDVTELELEGAAQKEETKVTGWGVTMRAKLDIVSFRDDAKGMRLHTVKALRLQTLCSL